MDFDFYVCSHPDDREISQRLIDSLSRYKLPKNVDLPDSTLSYKKIFADLDPAPFDEAATRQLDSCRVFLLLCSPRTKHYAPLTERLAYFENARGKTNIIAVIVEGEPIDAFPETFIEQRIVPHMLPDGTVEERTETIEPVASDLRGQDAKHTKRLLSYETVRIVASVLGLSPDMLEQRHNRRARRRMTVIVSTAGAVLLVAASVFAYFGYRAAQEGQIARRQVDESLAVIERLTEQLPETFKDDETALEQVEKTIRDAVDELGRERLEQAGVDVDALLRGDAS